MVNPDGENCPARKATPPMRHRNQSFKLSLISPLEVNSGTEKPHRKVEPVSAQEGTSRPASEFLTEQQLLNSMRCYLFTLDDCGSTLNAQEIDCNNAEEALQLGSAAVANDPVEFGVVHGVSPALSRSRGRSGRFRACASV